MVTSLDLTLNDFNSVIVNTTTILVSTPYFGFLPHPPVLITRKGKKFVK